MCSSFQAVSVALLCLAWLGLAWLGLAWLGLAWLCFALFCFPFVCFALLCFAHLGRNTSQVQLTRAAPSCLQCSQSGSSSQVVCSHRQCPDQLFSRSKPWCHFTVNGHHILLQLQAFQSQHRPAGICLSIVASVTLVRCPCCSKSYLAGLPAGIVSLSLLIPVCVALAVNADTASPHIVFYACCYNVIYHMDASRI